ncbi:DNA-binding transcriptional response regulator, NtrC family, contains REC, AAA-type ATPase, and a Fis-type DNA-binding domains [Lysobacter sp. yr284]|uniref:sigma-54-dependent transcriptional regulator n=1 Tax=Lysobacter sp. yr284 TaxID=1761791 RepID=UPI000899D6CD|nr:sigma-54 dependent transcriptional regulator [Lysobacter sp. yr284]SDY83061.1 DNA-binding transcriptional response regulator, NtrC family, contains REC, AAA-type ATPase, and a Fis-type DNA-binding domains [Lysobacter sp. yr284]
MRTVLVIDDNPAVGTALDLLFGLRDIRVLTAQSPQQGLDLLAREDIGLVLQDMNFTADTTSGQEGVALFRAIRARHPDLPIILLTAWTHLDIAVDLAKAGAADYLAKPWDDQKLLASVENLLELGASTREVSRLHEQRRRVVRELEARYDLRGLVFASEPMTRVVELACHVARADVPVLIVGPNGAGKEKIAEIVQANSAVKAGAFVTLNCGALPTELIEAELFGADAGAYTGANKMREGKFEAADGGTLFLDEIGNLPPAGQMKLLRVLETGRFERLGSNRERQVRVRVISATNADLPAMIRDGRFREDLYYRLNTIQIAIPPLGERRDDVLPLARHFLADNPLGAGKRLGEDAERALLAHPWPGNVRELRNTLQRAALLARGDSIAAADLGLPSAPAAAAAAPVAGAEEPDRAAIEAAIERAGGVLAQAAGELGLSRQALYRRLDRLGIKRD